MTNISIELVPRTLASLEQEMQAINTHFPQINTINVPDLLRFDVRSWDACIRGKRCFSTAIPHIRSMDFDLSKPFELGKVLLAENLDTVLLVTGDIPQDMSKRVYNTACLDFIRFFKRKYPATKVYASIDSYRSGTKQELNYVKQKLDAGADGFFTQPFFDMRLLEIYYDQLSDCDVYWGVSPVLTEGSKNYWEAKNNVVFPKDFTPNMEWNTQFGKDVLSFAQANSQNVYYMPIRADVIEYLRGVLT